jgi:5'-3' exonuclease
MKYCIIDATNLIHRARRVQGTNDVDIVVPLSIQTVFQSMNKVFNKFNAEHAVVCFDGSSWRKIFYEKYKAHREENVTRLEQKIRDSITTVVNDLEAFLRKSTNTTVLRNQLIEADDFIARWILLHPNDEHVIVSADGDFKQLVSENVVLYNGVANELTTLDGIFFQDGQPDPKKKYPRVQMYGETWKQKLVKEKNIITDEPVKVEPKWELFLKTMKGDVSDNIPAAHIPRYRTKKIREAFENPGGAAWTDMMNAIKEREVYEEDGVKMIRDVTVHDLYERNTLLVDLTKQPEEIIELIDQTIEEAVSEEPKKMIGVEFRRYCGRNKLIRLGEFAHLYADLLSRRYNHAV